MIVLDTNILSEALRPKPFEAVLEWLRSQPAELLFTTAITEAELLYGIELLPVGRRRSALRSAIEALFAQVIAGRVLVFDSPAAREYASIAAARRRSGRPIADPDARIAAIARAHDAALATRNIADFEGCELELVNPWDWQ